ncbi:MAG TPA: MarR family transcriptional regulator [Nakamurella sp.]|nr:MarR family transcriptional regulator [Nakamurella sp.]
MTADNDEGSRREEFTLRLAGVHPVSGGQLLDDPTDRRAVAQEVTYLILEMSQRLQDHFSHHAQLLGMSAAQAKILAALAEAPGTPMRALANRVGFDPSNLTSHIDRLEERGDIIRQPEPSDRRVKLLSVTPQGAALFKAFWTAMSQDVSFADKLDSAQLGTLRTLLRHALGTPAETGGWLAPDA